MQLSTLSFSALLIALIAPVALAAPFPTSGVGLCPSVSSGITDPLAICTAAGGPNGPSFDTEAGFEASGSEFQSSMGSQASGSAVISSVLRHATFTMFGDKAGVVSFGVADVTGEVSWSDTLTIESPGLAGQAGTFQVSMFLTLSEELIVDRASANTAFSDVVYTMAVVSDGDGWGFSGEIGIRETAGGIEVLDQGDPPGLFRTGDLDFVFGTPFELDVETRIVIEASVDGPLGTASTSAVADFAWLGFDEVRLVSDGSLVTDFSLTSGTGVDWTQPPPDQDGDGTPDSLDNCLEVANGPALGDPPACDGTGITPSQMDIDQDGYGNPCDLDVNQNGEVDLDDLARTFLEQGSTTELQYDYNCNGQVDLDDLAESFLQQGELVGPSGLACAGTIPCP